MTMDAEAIAELFAAFGPVQVRRMFSGAGLYSEGTFFAIVIDGVIYLKADEVTVPRFAAEGCRRFSYTTRQRTVETNLWRMPERLYDDPDELADWARQACAAAMRAGATRKKPGKRKTASKRVAKSKVTARKDTGKKKATARSLPSPRAKRGGEGRR